MKLKMNFKINTMSIETSKGIIETPAVDVTSEIETTVTELRGAYELKKTILDETPALAEKFAREFLRATISIQEDYEKAFDAMCSQKQKAAAETHKEHAPH